MVRDVYLHGSLGKTYGRHFRLDVETPAEAVRALAFQMPGFRQDISKAEWRIVRGPKKGGEDIGEIELGLRLGTRPLHIMPAPKGRKNSDATTKIVIGVAIMAAAVVTGGAAAGAFGGVAATATTAGAGVAGAVTSAGVVAGSTWLGSSIAIGGLLSVSMGQIALLGAAITLAGISMLTAPQAKAPTTVGQIGLNQSFLLSGPQNNGQQGLPVPVVYGRVRTGSVQMSSDLRVEEWNPNLSGAIGLVNLVTSPDNP